jgi:hypothetical protein
MESGGGGRKGGAGLEWEAVTSYLWVFLSEMARDKGAKESAKVEVKLHVRKHRATVGRVGEKLRDLGRSGALHRHANAADCEDSEREPHVVA